MRTTQARKIKCRNCRKPTVFAAENPFRPFCSERCRLIDLGDWAAGNHCIAGENLSSEIDANSNENAKEFDEQ
jgi:endogenous inhibitor of DNA gyrase (YacG/DUF329 family)